MTKYIKLIINVIFILIIATEHAYPKTPHSIRLAIFDNPQPDPSRNENSQQFVNSYLAGINTAITVAASKGILITEKEFFHGNDLASVIQQASNAKAWKPDVIIGLSTSNDFLMSKAFFGEQVILSISATDPAIATLPPGFYSLGMPDTEAVKTIINFIHQHYKDSNLFITVAAESKESVDFADLLAVKYKNLYKNKTVTERKFLTDDMDTLDISKFLSGYNKDDVIVVMSIGYDSAIDLMNKISSHLQPIKPIFITSTDNWGNNSSPQKITGKYDAYRIDTLSGGEDTNEYKFFLDNFQRIYHTPPKDKISFVTYQAVMSVIQASLQYESKSPASTNKQAILNSYLLALKHNPNWYRPKYYVVYKLENKNEIYFDKIK
jgi:hypothetical protein